MQDSQRLFGKIHLSIDRRFWEHDGRHYRRVGGSLTGVADKPNVRREKLNFKQVGCRNMCDYEFPMNVIRLRST